MHLTPAMGAMPQIVMPSANTGSVLPMSPSRHTAAATSVQTSHGSRAPSRGKSSLCYVTNTSSSQKKQLWLLQHHLVVMMVVIIL